MSVLDVGLCTTYMPGAMETKEVSDSLGTGVTDGHVQHVGAGNQIWVPSLEKHPVLLTAELSFQSVRDLLKTAISKNNFIVFSLLDYAITH